MLYSKQRGVIMKKSLYTLLTINIVALVFGFIFSLFTVPIYSLICLLLGPIELVPLFAIINNIESIEDLNYEIYELKSRLKRIEDSNIESATENYTYVQSVEFKESARGTWECVKCGTVNKEGTDTCNNCKAPYSPFINPTSNPYEKKKVSRWIKEKDK